MFDVRRNEHSGMSGMFNFRLSIVISYKIGEREREREIGKGKIGCGIIQGLLTSFRTS